MIILIDQNSKMAKVKGKGSHWLKKIIMYWKKKNGAQGHRYSEELQ